MHIHVFNADNEPEYDACGNEAVAAIEDEGVHLPLCEYCLCDLVNSAIQLKNNSEQIEIVKDSEHNISGGSIIG